MSNTSKTRTDREIALRAIQTEFPHWRRQISYLSSLLSESTVSLCVSGPHVEDASQMLRKVLALWPIRVAFVRISEVFWSRNQFFESILVQLRVRASELASLSHHPHYSNGHMVQLIQGGKRLKASERCGTSATFVESLKDIFLSSDVVEARECAYIVLEEVEKLDLKVFGDKILPLMMRLQELTSAPIGVIMVSSCTWADLQPEFAVSNPMLLHLPSPQYNHLIVMLQDNAIHLPQSFVERIAKLNSEGATSGKGDEKFVTFHYWRDFIHLMVSALEIAFSTKRELVYIAHILFPRYLDPVISAFETDSLIPTPSQLYPVISPYFQLAVSIPSLALLETEAANLASKKGPELDHWDLPLVCKYLILAGWIASKNPNVDEMIKDRRRRRKGAAKKSEASRLEEAAFAPSKPWRIDKLLSILDHILAGNQEEEENQPNDANIEDKDAQEAQRFILAAVGQSSPVTHSDSHQTNVGSSSRSEIIVDPSESEMEAVNATFDSDATFLGISLPATPVTSADNSVDESEAHDSIWSEVQFDPDVEMQVDDNLPATQTTEASDRWDPNRSMTSINESQVSALSGFQSRKKRSRDIFLSEAPSGPPFFSHALFPLYWDENKENGNQVEILAQIGVLEHIGLFARLSASTSEVHRSRSQYRCTFEASFANKIAESINFPLWGFL